MNPLNEKRCCEKCDNQFHGGSFPRCACHSPKEKEDTQPSFEWEKEFEEKWKLYMGDCQCNKEAFFKPFIRKVYALGKKEGEQSNCSKAEEIGRAVGLVDGYERGKKEGAAEVKHSVTLTLEKLQEEAFESDTGPRIEIFINWEKTDAAIRTAIEGKENDA